MSTPYEPLAVSMNAGYQSGRGTESPGLEAQSAKFNALVQAQVGKPAASVLSQVRPSNIASNAGAPSMSERVMPDGSLLPSTNGTDEQTYGGDTQLRLRGALPL